MAELTAAVQGLFEELTLQGYARRHPGLEHHAGVPVGGTLVLAYVSLADLAQQIGPIVTLVGQPIAGLNTLLAPAASPVALDSAVQDLAAAAADRTEEPLDQFIVLADFCLPYQCCDADCSDVALSDSIIADPFGQNTDPGPMAVPPIDTAEPPPTTPGTVPGATTPGFPPLGTQSSVASQPSGAQPPARSYPATTSSTAAMMPGPEPVLPPAAVKPGPVAGAASSGATSSGGASYGVLFASYDSADQARQGWNQIWNRYWSVLSGVTPYIEYGTVGNSANRFNLYGKTATRAHASRLCQGIRQRGAACTLVYF